MNGNHHLIHIIFLLCSLFVFGNSSRGYLYNPRIAGSILNSSITEPALIPFSAEPHRGMTIPLPLSGTFELSNDQFTMFNPITLFFYRKNPGTLLSHLLCSSFGISGLPPEAVSQVLSEKLEDGMTFTFDADYTFMHLAKRLSEPEFSKGFAVQLKSYSSATMHVPGDAFQMVFSQSDGLQQGNTLTLDEFESEMRVLSELSGSYGREIPRKLSLFEKPFTLSWGVTGAYKMGHMLFRIETENAEIVYKEDNTMSIDGNAKIISAGIAINDNGQFITAFRDGVFNGHGLGISAGTALSFERLLLSVSVNNLGFMAWNSSTQNQELSFCDDSLYLTDFQNDSLFSVNYTSSAENVVFAEKSFSSVKVSYFSRSNAEKKPIEKLSSARAASLGYIQPFYADSQNRKRPLFFGVFENEFLNRRVPARIGWEYQSKQNYASFLEVEQVLKSLTVSFWYRAHCDALFRASKGGEVGIRTRIFW